MDSLDTRKFAAFIATRAELAAALPGWRAPLSEPGDRYGLGTRLGRYVFRTKDPEPGAVAPVPATLPFPSVRLPPKEDWEQRYVALDFALRREKEFSEDEWETRDFWQTMEKRQLFEEPLFGAADAVNPCWIIADD